MKKIGIIIFILVAIVGAFPSSNGEISGEFLTLPVGPKAYALGNAMVTANNDPLSIFYNIANITSFPKVGIAVGQSNYFIGTKIEYFAFCIPFTATDYFGLGVNAFYTDPIDLYTWDDPMESHDQFDVTYNNLLVGYGKKLNKNFSFGLAYKFYKEEIVNIKSNTGLIDFGLKYDFSKGSFGFSIRNLGNSLYFDRKTETDYVIETEKIPTGILIGGNYNVNKSLNLKLQSEFIAKHSAAFSIGLEYTLFDLLPLRIGYTNVDEAGLGFGFGLRHTFTKMSGKRRVNVVTLEFDYSYAVSSNIEDTHHFGMSLVFE